MTRTPPYSSTALRSARPGAFYRHVALLLCGVLLLMRIGGAHWHLCFDGQEPPVSIHVADGAVEHAAGAIGNPHHDQNVDIGSASLVKHFFAGFDLLPLAIAALLLFAALPRLTTLRTRKSSSAPAWHDLSVLLPPPQGPPAIAIS